MNIWYIRLKGGSFELNTLTQLFTSEEVRIQKEDGEQNQYILKSIKFNKFSDPNDVFNKGKAIMQMVNGIGNLSFDYYDNVRCESVISIDDNGVKHGNTFFGTMQTIVRSHMSVNASVIRNGQEIEVGENSLSIQSKWLSLEDDNVKTVIRLLSYGLEDWVNLYRVFEIVEGDIRKKISDKGWVSAKSRNLFKHTANSPAILGDHARHGWNKQLPPKSPMNLHDAKDMIKSVIAYWLNEKVKKTDR